MTEQKFVELSEILESRRKLILLGQAKHTLSLCLGPNVNLNCDPAEPDRIFGMPVVTVRTMPEDTWMIVDHATCLKMLDEPGEFPFADHLG